MAGENNSPTSDLRRLKTWWLDARSPQMNATSRSISSRGDRTAIEVFVNGMRCREAGRRRLSSGHHLVACVAPVQRKWSNPTVRAVTLVPRVSYRSAFARPRGTPLSAKRDACGIVFDFAKAIRDERPLCQRYAAANGSFVFLWMEVCGDLTPSLVDQIGRQLAEQRADSLYRFRIVGQKFANCRLILSAIGEIERLGDGVQRGRFSDRIPLQHSDEVRCVYQRFQARALVLTDFLKVDFSGARTAGFNFALLWQKLKNSGPRCLLSYPATQVCRILADRSKCLFIRLVELLLHAHATTNHRRELFTRELLHFGMIVDGLHRIDA